MRARLHWIAIGCALAVVVAAGWRGRADAERGAPSEVVYPPQRLPLTFSHARHLALPGMTCVGCHVDAGASRSAVDNLMPVEAVCARCHAIDRGRSAEGWPLGPVPV